MNPDRLPKWIRVRPDLVEAEADRIRQLPEISYAAMWAQTAGRLSYGAQHTQFIAIMGADDRYQEIQGGELLDGRWFTPAELASGASVVVLDENAAHKLFGRESILDKEIRVGGRPARVIGLYAQPGNIFSPPGQDIGAIVPYQMLDHQFTIDKTNALYIPVKPKKGVATADAQEAVTIALREMRRLHPADKNNFDLITQDQILDTFNKITGVFFLVMIVLSSVGLLVGGIGVMAIMMVSVTSRTREIGIRKGARRDEARDPVPVSHRGRDAHGTRRRARHPDRADVRQARDAGDEDRRRGSVRPHRRRGDGLGEHRDHLRNAPRAAGGEAGSDRRVAVRVATLVQKYPRSPWRG